MRLLTPLKYKAWADRRTLNAVAQIVEVECPAAFAFARQQLNHMVRVEELFRARLVAASDPHTTTNTDWLPRLEELDRRLMASNQWLQDYANELGPDQANERVRFQFVDGASGMLSREEVI
ncbi:MAG: damage-inducible protein DinB, partial [Burkholderiaceae bacterium]|nr:damage-inducible protein DinB [Burkholderiaceae bacterium]